MTRLPALLRRDFIGSVQGQLTLLALTYAGAVALAVLALCVRDYFFEYHVRERYPEASASVLAKIRRAGGATANVEALEPLSTEEREAVYGAWISDPSADPTGQAAVRLLWTDPDELIRRARITAVAGNLAQRLRALDLLSYGKQEVRDEAIALCRYLAERGRRRGERALVDKANHVLGRLEQTS